jgi:hypothetical protein
VASQANVKVGNAYKTVNGVNVRVQGTWKSVRAAYVRVNGVWKSTYAQQVTVPNVTGIAYNTALSTLQGLGFTVVQVNQVENTTNYNSYAGGYVYGQDVTSGTAVNYGSTITLSTYSYLAPPPPPPPPPPVIISFFTPPPVIQVPPPVIQVPPPVIQVPPPVIISFFVPPVIQVPPVIVNFVPPVIISFFVPPVIQVPPVIISYPPPIISFSFFHGMSYYTPPPIISFSFFHGMSYSPPPVIISSPPPVIISSPPPPTGCIQGDTLVLTTDGLIPMRDITVGQKIVSYSFNELPESERAYNPETWTAKTLTGSATQIATITGIQKTMRATTMTFNKDPGKRFSLEQTLFVKRKDTYMFIQSGVVEIGDILIEKDGDVIKETPVNMILYIDEETDVYQVNVDEFDLIVAGNLVAHNFKPRFHGPTKRDVKSYPRS